MKLALAALAAAAWSLPAAAAPLTIRTGESWIFVVQNGAAAKARKVAPSARPKPGEILASVSGMMGTTMTLVSRAPVSYTFRAELIGAPKGRGTARTCTLPANGRPTMENWPIKAQAVRLSNFRPAAADRC